MDCAQLFGWSELLIAAWIGGLFGCGAMALAQMAGDRTGVRERETDDPHNVGGNPWN